MNQQENANHEIGQKIAMTRYEQRLEEHFGEYVDNILTTEGGYLTPHKFHLYHKDDNARHRRDFATLFVKRLQAPNKIVEALFTDLYTGYPRYKTMIGSNMADFEGGACSVDKTHVLLGRIYPAWLSGRDHAYTDGGWNTPEITTFEAWCELVKALQHVGMGDYTLLPPAWETLQKKYQ